jgi:hypothetical protein
MRASGFIDRVFKQPLKLISSTAAKRLLQIENQEAGANSFGIELWKNRASPAINDFTGGTAHYSNNNLGVKTYVGGFDIIMTNVTSGAEASVVRINNKIAGVANLPFQIGGGAFTSNSTGASDVAGGDKGYGSINADSYYTRGVAMPFTKEFVSAAQTITVAGLLTLPHSLGVQPKLYWIELTCVTGELNYTAGDETIPAAPYCSIVPDATNLNIRFASVVPQVYNKTTGAATNITAVNWNAIFKAWA